MSETPVRYETIAISNESTVVAEFVADDVREERYQSEAALERDFIERLQAQAYEYLTFTSEADLIGNLRQQLEALLAAMQIHPRAHNMRSAFHQVKRSDGVLSSPSRA